MTGPDVTGVGEYAEKAARDTEPLSDRMRQEEHLWLSGVRRDPQGEVRFIPSNPDHGMSGTYAGQVTASIDAMLTEARAEERERTRGLILMLIDERQTWLDTKRLSAAGEDRTHAQMAALEDALDYFPPIARGEAT